MGLLIEYINRADGFRELYTYLIHALSDKPIDHLQLTLVNIRDSHQVTTGLQEWITGFSHLLSGIVYYESVAVPHYQLKIRQIDT